MASTESLKRATLAHAKSRDGLIVQLLKLLLGLWSDFDRWDDEQAVVGMAARSASIVDASNLSVRRLQRSYLTSVLREMDVMPATLPPIVNSYPRANTNATEVYQRPVEQYVWQRREGGTLEESAEAFAERLRTIAEMDARAAERDEATAIYNAVPLITGHRRVIHPELSASGTCGLCVVASSQWYRYGDLEPLHDGCNCDTLPTTSNQDPGLRLNADDLKTIYAAAGDSTAAEDLVNTRITINEHGELGPILVKQGDHFKTAEEAGRPRYVKPTPETVRRSREDERSELTDQLGIAEKRYSDLLAQNPDALTDTSVGNSERVALFRSIRFMRERVAQLDTFISTLAA